MAGSQIRMALAPVFLLVLAACAGSVGGYRPVTPSTAASAGDPISTLALAVEAEPGVVITDAERQRILSLIRWYMPRDCPGGPSPAMRETEAPVEARIRLTRYDKGNAFARAMLIGLGQIHIDAELELRARADDRSLARYEVSKTFAWGGLYGGMTRMEDVEHGFARAVVAAICEATRRPAGA